MGVDAQSPIPFAILLNGTSSSGKSSIARCLHSTVGLFAFYLCIDMYIDMLPMPFVGESLEASKGFKFYTHGKNTRINVGELGEFVIRQMHDTAKEILRQNSCVIIDHIMLNEKWVDDLLSIDGISAKIYKVLVTCDNNTLLIRESGRNDRRLGLAQGLKYTEKNITTYDFVIDTTNKPAELLADEIIEFITNDRGATE
jgi:chloramphenicol 3-O phosphotransferase